jgi:hypothetical protein
MRGRDAASLVAVLLLVLPGLGGTVGIAPAALPLADAAAPVGFAACDLASPPRSAQGAEDTHECTLVRPGRQFLVGGHLCSLGFLLRDASGTLYALTAGHCIPATGPMAVTVAGIGDIGDPVFTTGNGGVGNDFALIRLDDGVPVASSVCVWGGPTRAYSASGVVDDAPPPCLPCRRGTLYAAEAPTTLFSAGRAGTFHSELSTPTSFRYTGLLYGPGDSGAPIMLADGAALGIITHYVGAMGLPGTIFFGTRLDVILSRLEAALQTDLELVPGEPGPLIALLDSLE